MKTFFFRPGAPGPLPRVMVGYNGEGGHYSEWDFWCVVVVVSLNVPPPYLCAHQNTSILTVPIDQKPYIYL